MTKRQLLGIAHNFAGYYDFTLDDILAAISYANEN